MNRQEKEAVVAELRDKLVKCKAAILTDYRGLKVTEITELRQKLQEAGVEYRVVKNTLTRLAAKDTVASALMDHLAGPCALAFSYDDEVSPARLLLDFAKTNDKLEVKAGVLAGRLLLQEDLKKVITLPSKEALQAQLLGAMVSLPASLLGVMSGVPRGLINVLAATPRNLLTVLKGVEQKAASTDQQNDFN